jgi:predicted metal-dependent phosphoesterase TrpH
VPRSRRAAPPVFDLQSHSRHSDGALSPGEVVDSAARAGVELLALSDHDTIDGVHEAVDAGRAAGVEVVTAVEISALDETGADLHVLGYLIDPADRALAERLRSYRADREHRAERMAAALRELGFTLDEEVIAARLAKGKSVGRPHLSQAVVGHPGNVERLAAEGLKDDPSAFLAAYLIEGRPAFRPRLHPTVAEAIAAIHEAGGAAVWAHPFWDFTDPDQVLATIDRFVALGLDGVEAFYPTHSRQHTDLLAARCLELGLLSTGSSDFHGPEHRHFSRFRGFSTYGHDPVLGPIGAAR